MKVVQINSVCGQGSTGKICVDLSRRLAERGIENYIIYGIGKSEYPLGICVSNRPYIKFNILLTRVFGKHGFYSHIATRKMIKHLNCIKPDIIHLHNIHGHYLNVRMLFNHIKKHNIKVIWSLHDCWSFTGHCSHFDFVKCEKWKTGCHNCEQLREYPISLVFDRSRGTYKLKKKIFGGVKNMLIVPGSEWLGTKVRESFLNKYDCVVLNSGIDTQLFKPCESDVKEKLGIVDKKMLLAVSAQFGERKGYKYYIELANLLTDEYVLVMVGVSEEQKKELPKNVIGITRTENQNELVKLYSAAEMLINLTLEETFGMVNAEALACGTPVLTWHVGGCPEVIGDDCGIVTEAFDIKAIKEAIPRIINTDYSERCRERAVTKYDTQIMIDNYMKAYGI